MSWRIIPTIFGKGWRFPGFGPGLTPWSFNIALELSWHLWVCHLLALWGSRSSLVCHLGPIWFMGLIGLCCFLGLCHSFKSFALPLSLLLQNCQHPLDHGKSKRVTEKHLLLLYWLCQSLWLWITANCGKFWKKWVYQTTWPASWEICMQVFLF